MTLTVNYLAHERDYYKEKYNETLLQRDELLAAVKRLTRWVGKGIADKAFENCVLPRAAESDLAFAEAAIRHVGQSERAAIARAEHNEGAQ